MAKREQKVEDANELPALEAGVSEIKDLFRAGAVPREADYAKLIEYVHYLHKLLGVEGEGEEEYIPKLGAGLVASGEVLSVGEGPGIKVSEDSVSVNLDSLAGKGLIAAEGKLNLGPSFWFDLNGEGVDESRRTWEIIFSYMFGFSFYMAVSDCCVFSIQVSGDNLVVRGFSKGGASFEKGAISKFKLNGVPASAEGSEVNFFVALLLFDVGESDSHEIEIPLSRNNLGVSETVKLNFRLVGSDPSSGRVSTSS